MRFTSAILIYLLTLGCAAKSDVHNFGGPRIDPPPGEGGEQTSTQPVQEVKVEKKTPAEQAKTYRTAAECATNAKSMHTLNPRFAWALYAECAKRKDFTDIYKLLSPPWVEEIKRHGKNGVRAVANVLANRGGDLKLDLAHVNEKGIQIFRLVDAVKNPSVFRGRYVLMRGKILNKVNRQNGVKIKIAELTLQAENLNYGTRWAKKDKTYYHGKKSGVSAYGERRKRTYKTWQKETVRHSRNLAIETNNQVIGYMGPSKKELKAETEYLFLIKFTELQPKSGVDEEERNIAVAAVIDHFPPITENQL